MNEGPASAGPLCIIPVEFSARALRHIEHECMPARSLAVGGRDNKEEKGHDPIAV